MATDISYSSTNDLFLQVMKRFGERELIVKFPSQITDGCVLEVYDKLLNIALASARLRLVNRVICDEKTTELFVGALITDLVWLRTPQVKEEPAAPKQPNDNIA